MTFTQDLHRELTTVLADNKPHDPELVVSQLPMRVSMVNYWEDELQSTTHTVVRSEDTGQFAEVVSYHPDYSHWSNTTVKRVFALHYKNMELPVFAEPQPEDHLVSVKSEKLQELLDNLVGYCAMTPRYEQGCVNYYRPVGLSAFRHRYVEEGEFSPKVELPDGVEMMVAHPHNGWGDTPPQMFHAPEMSSFTYPDGTTDYGMVFHDKKTGEYVAVQCSMDDWGECADNKLWKNEDGYYQGMNNTLWVLRVDHMENDYRYVRVQ